MPVFVEGGFFYPHYPQAGQIEKGENTFNLKESVVLIGNNMI